MATEIEGSFLDDVTPDAYVNYDEAVGTDFLQSIGLPGQGKSSIVTTLVLYCLKKGEKLIMEGDRFCEWRHYLNYPHITTGVLLIVPHNQKIFYHNFPDDITDKYNVPFQMIELDYEKLNIMQIINDNPLFNVFVIYDAHYRGELIWKRAELWVNITNQELDRITHLNIALINIYHEAGILWQEGASDKHWAEIKKYSQILVECRKGLVRPIFISQLETEIFQAIRAKCLWRIYKKGITARHNVHPSIQKNAPFLPRHKFIITYGGMFIPDNQVEPIKEIKKVWKMIPQGMPDIEEKPKSNREYPINDLIFEEAKDLLLTNPKISKRGFATELGLQREKGEYYYGLAKRYLKNTGEGESAPKEASIHEDI